MNPKPIGNLVKSQVRINLLVNTWAGIIRCIEEGIGFDTDAGLEDAGVGSVGDSVRFSIRVSRRWKVK